MKFKKIVASVAAATMGMMALTGCGGSTSSADAETIKIGASFDLTGGAAQYGIAASNGVKLAIKEYNEAGGVLDKQISLELVDNKSSQTDTANAAKKLIEQDKVVGIIGSDLSSTTQVIANIAQEKNIPMITPTGTTKAITETGDSIFRACYIDPDQGNMIARVAVEELGAKTAAIMINSESDYSVGIAEAFTAKFEELGGSIVETVNYGGNDVDFKPVLVNVKNASPDVIILPDYYETIAKVAPQAQEIGIEAPFIGGDGWDGVLQQLGDHAGVVEGSFFINHYALEDESTVVQEFIKNYEAEYGETPNAFAALGYDAARVMIEAIKTAGSTDADAVKEALVATNLECVTGTIQFDAKRNPIKPVSIIEIKDGVNTLYKKIEIER